jgi:hypothetical protein
MININLLAKLVGNADVSLDGITVSDEFDLVLRKMETAKLELETLDKVVKEKMKLFFELNTLQKKIEGKNMSVTNAVRVSYKAKDPEQLYKKNPALVEEKVTYALNRENVKLYEELNRVLPDGVEKQVSTYLLVKAKDGQDKN